MANFRWQVGECGCDCVSDAACNEIFERTPCLLGGNLTKTEVISVIDAWDSKYKRFIATIFTVTSSLNGDPGEFMTFTGGYEQIGDAEAPGEFTPSGPYPGDVKRFALSKCAAPHVLPDPPYKEWISGVQPLEEKGFHILSCESCLDFTRGCPAVDKVFSLNLPVKNLSSTRTLNSLTSSEATKGMSTASTARSVATITCDFTDTYTATIKPIQPGGYVRVGTSLSWFSPYLAYYRFFPAPPEVVLGARDYTNSDRKVFFADDILLIAEVSIDGFYGFGMPITDGPFPTYYMKLSSGSYASYKKTSAFLQLSSSHSFQSPSFKTDKLNVITPPSAPTKQGDCIQFPDVSFEITASGSFTAILSYGMGDTTEEDFLANATPDNTVKYFDGDDYEDVVVPALNSMLNDNEKVKAWVNSAYNPNTSCRIGYSVEEAILFKRGTSLINYPVCKESKSND